MLADVSRILAQKREDWAGSKCNTRMPRQIAYFSFSLAEVVAMLLSDHVVGGVAIQRTRK